MAAKGPNAPGTAVDDATVGTVAWSNPNNAKVLDSVYAKTSKNMGTGTADSHFLLVSNFGFAIPLGVTILGIVANVVYTTNNTGFNKDATVKLVKGGVIGGTDKSTDAIIAPGTLVYGGTTDLWGQTWTPSDINDSTFGFAFSTTINPVTFNMEDDVDIITLTVYHSEVTMIAAQGSYTLTGQSITLTRQILMTVTVGLYALTGQIATLASSLWTRLTKSVSTFTNQSKSS